MAKRMRLKTAKRVAARARASKARRTVEIFHDPKTFRKPRVETIDLTDRPRVEITIRNLNSGYKAAEEIARWMLDKVKDVLTDRFREKGDEVVTFRLYP